MTCTAGHRQVVAALCAVVAWSLFAPTSCSAALNFGAPTKLSRMSFDVADYSMTFFKASHTILPLNNKSSASHPHLRSVAAIQCALATDEDSSECEALNTMRLRAADSNTARAVAAPAAIVACRDGAPRHRSL
ncbi:hypothetical protein T484DRAFT_1751548 [Baffinella frigidus]|nr:hypothetical protein T484DRAFT_1751548 [Cryptophyta sp. CCMP2293]